MRAWDWPCGAVPGRGRQAPVPGRAGLDTDPQPGPGSVTTKPAELPLPRPGPRSRGRADVALAARDGADHLRQRGRRPADALVVHIEVRDGADAAGRELAHPHAALGEPL